MFKNLISIFLINYSMNINKDLCCGCAACVHSFPDNFYIGKDGKSEINLDLEFPEEAIAVCPLGAIEN